MSSQGWWSRHRLFPALSLALTVPLHSGVHCSAGCTRVSCIVNFHRMYKSSLRPTTTLLFGQRESVLSRLAHYLLLSRVITSVLQHIVNNRKKKCVQYFVWEVWNGRELWPVFKYDTAF